MFNLFDLFLKNIVIMTIIKKNIWLVFYVISFVWILFVLMSVYFMSVNVYKEYSVEQKNVTSMTANSLEAVLKKYEVFLDILTLQLLDQNLYLNEIPAQNLMDTVTQIEPTIRAFGIFNPDGTVYITSSNIYINDGPSLLAQEETRDSFLQTLSSSNMVIGRTYSPNGINDNKVIIPLRRAIRDAEGNVKFVLSFAIDAQTAFNFFINSSTEQHEYTTYLYRERDRYFQLASPNRLRNDTSILHYQISEATIKKSTEKFVEQVGVPYETIKQEQMLVSSISDFSQEQRLLASKYIKRYGLWIVTDISINQIHKTIIYKSVTLFTIFLSSLFIIYWLFRYIAKIENKKQEDLLYQASHDYVTKLNNRFFLEELICLNNADDAYWLILIDIDNFSSINVSYGHESGDQALMMISERLNKLINNDDLLIRYSGNEFIIISYKVEIEEIKVLCEDILVSLRQPYSYSWGNFILTASIGGISLSIGWE